jgi:hypothetical protein
MDKPRMWWAGDKQGWVVDVVDVLSDSELKRCVEFTLKVQNDRYQCLLPGDRKDECLRTIAALAQNKVTQNIVGKGDHRIFDAYNNRGLPNGIN